MEVLSIKMSDNDNATMNNETVFTHDDVNGTEWVVDKASLTQQHEVVSLDDSISKESKSTSTESVDDEACIEESSNEKETKEEANDNTTREEEKETEEVTKETNAEIDNDEEKSSYDSEYSCEVNNAGFDLFLALNHIIMKPGNIKLSSINKISRILSHYKNDSEALKDIMVEMANCVLDEYCEDDSFTCSCDDCDANDSENNSESEEEEEEDNDDTTEEDNISEENSSEENSSDEEEEIRNSKSNIRRDIIVNAEIPNIPSILSIFTICILLITLLKNLCQYRVIYCEGVHKNPYSY
jgi:hypothetical protein